MSIFAVQRIEGALLGCSAGPLRQAPVVVGPVVVGPVDSGLQERALVNVVPSDQRVGLSLEVGLGTFRPVILPVPTFGRTRAGYLVTKSWFSGASDHQHAGPATVTGLAGIHGSNDA